MVVAAALRVGLSVGFVCDDFAVRGSKTVARIRRRSGAREGASSCVAVIATRAMARDHATPAEARDTPPRWDAQSVDSEAASLSTSFADDPIRSYDIITMIAS